LTSPWYPSPERLRLPETTNLHKNGKREKAASQDAGHGLGNGGVPQCRGPDAEARHVADRRGPTDGFRAGASLPADGGQRDDLGCDFLSERLHAELHDGAELGGL